MAESLDGRVHVKAMFGDTKVPARSLTADGTLSVVIVLSL